MNQTITDQIIEEISRDPNYETMLERQTDLEDRMRGMGVDRHWSNIRKAQDKGRETSTSSVRRLLHFATEGVADGIREFIEHGKNRKAGRHHAALDTIQLLKPEENALLACRVVLDGVASGRKLVPIANQIAHMIEDEVSYQRFKKEDKKAYQWLQDREKKNLQRRPYDLTRKVVKANMENRGIEFEDWTTHQRTSLGLKLITLMASKTGLINIESRYTGKNRTDKYIVATQETMSWIEQENSRSEILSPVYLPTVMPPKPWTTPLDGGYWTSRVRRLKLIKTFNKAYLDELGEMDMPQVYDAVNGMQHTAWSINPGILASARILWSNGSELGDIPKAEDHEIPPKPVFLDRDDYQRDDWSDEHLDEFKQWKRKASDIHVANDQLRSLRLQLVKILMVAEMFEHEEAIYFPHQLDFRGRCYAVPMFLNPQGSDLAKAMLQFADGAPINDEEGRAWLAIHGANVFGYDKDSLEGRVAWVEENQAEILASADDPYNNRFWNEADDPFQFLAFCLEWSRFQAEGWGFMSTLPVQMDGSCNGLQNFSAALRDPVGGDAVNLTPQDKPADIYQRVADIVEQRAMEDAKQDEDPAKRDLALGWLKLGITRKTCKRPVMTLAYGAKEYGFKDQVNEDIIKPAKMSKKIEFPWDDSGWPAANYMGKLIWESVSEVVVAARGAMDWFQKAARAATKEGLPIRWTTPDGLPVQQAYVKLDTKRIDLTFDGLRLQTIVAFQKEGPMELERSRQVNGIAPNWVHSMDASHMRGTVRKCWAEGIRSFALVHDSYGTHAANAWALADILREEFIDMYAGNDVLTQFKDELEDQLPEEAERLEDLPPKGTLDLDRVMQSDFFFA